MMMMMMMMRDVYVVGYRGVYVVESVFLAVPTCYIRPVVTVRCNSSAEDVGSVLNVSQCIDGGWPSDYVVLLLH